MHDMTQGIHRTHLVAAILLYWLPLVMCAIYYTKTAVLLTRRDWQARAWAGGDGYYYPTIKVGTLVWYVFVTIMPAFNLVVTIFIAAPDLFSKVIGWIASLLNTPLIPRRSKK